MANETMINGIDVQALGKTISTVRHSPPLGKFRFRAKNQWSTGSESRTTIENFYGVGEEHSSEARPFELEADEPEILLGRDSAPNPAEHLLHALAACVTTSMVYHAAARGLKLTHVESILEGELDVRGFMGIAHDVRKGYEKIKIQFLVSGDGSPEQLEELCQFSPVLDVITHGTEVSLDVKKVEVDRATAGTGQPEAPAP